MRDNDLTPCGF